MNTKENKTDLNPEELEEVSGGIVDFAGNQLNSNIAAGEAPIQQNQATAELFRGQRAENSVSIQIDEEMIRKAEDIISSVAQYKNTTRII
ncbi:MAG: hypothetical protein WCP79_02385 [Bacillota bacterium]